jgi:hypothetical protein
MPTFIEKEHLVKKQKINYFSQVAEKEFRLRRLIRTH